LNHEERNFIMFFPGKYKKPELQSIIEASRNGWSAGCDAGTTPGSGIGVCNTGATAGAGGRDGFDGRLYTNPDDSSRLLDPDEVNSGL
jgi:hypothetical protein